MIYRFETYRILRLLPRYVGVFVVVVLVPVLLFNSDNWLALVRGNRGDGLPVPGRTGREHSTIFTEQQHHHSTTNVLMAIKAFILAWKPLFSVRIQFRLSRFYCFKNFFFCFSSRLNRDFYSLFGSKCTRWWQQPIKQWKWFTKPFDDFNDFCVAFVSIHDLQSVMTMGQRESENKNKMQRNISIDCVLNYLTFGNPRCYDWISPSQKSNEIMIEFYVIFSLI